jgi:putative transposase
MRRIDELYLQYPFAGAGMLRDLLRQEGYVIGKRHVATLMGHMGIKAVYCKLCTSYRHATHTILSISPSESTDQSPQSRLGGGYHVYSYAPRLHVSLAVLDWASRRMLA